MVFSLCSCGNDSIGSAKKLTAQNFTELCDLDGYLYAFGGMFDSSVILFDSSSNKIKTQGLNDDFSFDQEKLLDSEEVVLTVSDDQHFTLEEEWRVTRNMLRNPLHFTLLYSDPDGQYVIFADDERKSKENDFLYYQTTFGNKQLVSSVINKYLQNDMHEQINTLTLEQWISFVDSCK